MFKILPIGSVVILKGAEKRVMITGYFPSLPDKKQKFDYSACLYPEGIIDFDKILLLNHNDIEYIYDYGLNDQEFEEFRERLQTIKLDLEKNEKIEELSIEMPKKVDDE